MSRTVPSPSSWTSKGLVINRQLADQRLELFRLVVGGLLHARLEARLDAREKIVTPRCIAVLSHH